MANSDGEALETTQFSSRPAGMPKPPADNLTLTPLEKTCKTLRFKQIKDFPLSEKQQQVVQKIQQLDTKIGFW